VSAAPDPRSAPVPTPVSVVIPAHDEEAVIGRCLDALTRDADPGELEVVVVCNGCTDGTAAVAREALPAATVVELAVASKSAALNAGDEHATRFPRLYLDADIELPIGVLRATVRALASPGVLCAAPAPAFELRGRPRLVRAYYETWRQLPYFTEEMVGTGVYALSEPGRGRFDRFPDLTADDQFVLQQFAPAERRSLGDQHFVVHTPTTLAGLVAIRRRAYRGAAELAASGRAPHGRATGAGRRLLQLASSPRNWFPVAVFVTISAFAKLRARFGAGHAWERDDSARQAAEGPRVT
jgi:glycosyltransferase involved in cell wall biosynthesis